MPFRIYENKTEPRLCLIRIVEQECSYRATAGLPMDKENGHFYLQLRNKRRSKASASDAGTTVYEPGFYKTRLGSHGVEALLSEMCAAAGIEARTNHSLRRTSITKLYDAGVPEHEIMKRTRHRSLEGLRAYLGCVLSSAFAYPICSHHATAQFCMQFGADEPCMCVLESY